MGIIYYSLIISAVIIINIVHFYSYLFISFSLYRPFVTRPRLIYLSCILINGYHLLFLNYFCSHYYKHRTFLFIFVHFLFFISATRYQTPAYLSYILINGYHLLFLIYFCSHYYKLRSFQFIFAHFLFFMQSWLSTSIISIHICSFPFLYIDHSLPDLGLFISHIF